MFVFIILGCEGGECGLPEVKPNAGVSLPGGTDFFAVGIYECNDGYILSGDPSIYCQTSKTWTISNATCTGKHDCIIAIYTRFDKK